jgi:ADP-ribose pyrophosphatase
MEIQKFRRASRAKFTKRKTVYKGSIFTIQQAKAIYPSGTVKVFEYCLRGPGVGVLAFDHKNRLLLTREFREKQQKTVWLIPAGRADHERSVRHAANRELREEAGYRANKLKLFMENDPLHFHEHNGYIYLAWDLVRDPLPKDEGEEITVIPTPLSKAYKMALSGEIGTDFISLAIIRLYQKAKKVGLKKLLK